MTDVSPRERAEWESKRASYDVMAIRMEIRCAETLKDLHSMAYFNSPDPAVRFKIEGYVLGIQDEIKKLRKREAKLLETEAYWEEQCRKLIT